MDLPRDQVTQANGTIKHRPEITDVRWATRRKCSLPLTQVIQCYQSITGRIRASQTPG
jgi:hypothetical protein